MTGYPEAILARELELCYTAIALVTDYDVGIVAKEKLPPVSADEVGKVFAENNKKALELVLKMVEKMPEERGCECGESLVGARLG